MVAKHHALGLAIACFIFGFFTALTVSRPTDTKEPVLLLHNNVQHVLETRYNIQYPRSLLMSTVIQEASKKEDIPVSLLMAMIETESSYNPRAVSPRGAKGYLQVMSVWNSVCPYNMYDEYENILQGACAMKVSAFQAKSLTEGLVVYNIGMPNYVRNKSLSVGRSFRDDVLAEQRELEKVL